MKSSEFFGKFKSRYLWGNLLAMFLVVIAALVAVKYSLDAYTHHGESITVPDLKHKSYADAAHILDQLGMTIEVSDTGYVKNLPPDCILEQTPEGGNRVKSGHIVYVIINASHTPTLTLPDIIDNSSLREAMAKLTTMGFKVGMPKFVTGEKDWVYGVEVKGKSVTTGSKISIDDTVVILAGNGLLGDDNSVNVVDETEEGELAIDFDEDAEDEFEVVDGH